MRGCIGLQQFHLREVVEPGASLFHQIGRDIHRQHVP